MPSAPSDTLDNFKATVARRGPGARALCGMLVLACVTVGGLCFAWWHPEHTLWHFFVVTQLIPLFYLGLSWWTAARPATESDHA
jgi:hypothetical protein